ncbi:hypothetical protein [Burkholderia stagnalis]|uniref:hypothetical protein n=1 Tax=Burkholderia stagnalis TaxID=1503054 RepID=UPI000F582A5F|nr:hypothetical protein [Burkholderia stagnalis]
MSLHLEAATPAADQDENFLNQTFERVSANGLTVDGACRTLNDVHQALKGIDAIGRILLANCVAEDCCVPPLNRYLVGGLLEGVAALSSMAIAKIGDLADNADRRTRDAEVRHG